MDPLEGVLGEILTELREQNDDAKQGGGDYASRLRAALQQYRGGSRYAAPGAAEEVLDALASGGTVQGPRQLLEARGGARQATRRGGLTGVMSSLSKRAA